MVRVYVYDDENAKNSIKYCDISHEVCKSCNKRFKLLVELYHVLVCKSNNDLSAFLVTSFFNISRVNIIFFDVIKNSFVWLRPFLSGNTLLTFILVRSKNCHFVTGIFGILLLIVDTLNEEYNDEKVITG